MQSRFAAARLPRGSLIRGSFFRAMLFGSMVLVAFAAPAAPADGSTASSSGSDSWDIGAKVSTLGIGVEVRRSFGDAFALRGVLNRYSYAVNEDVDDVAYEGDLDLQSAGLIADWHPAGSSFRISAGLLFNGNELTVDAEPSGGTFEFAGQTYTAAEIGTAQGDADFNTLSPYLGMGFGRDFGSDSQFGVSLDVGVLFQGEPKFNLDVTCGSAVPELRCTQLVDDVEAERRQFEDDAKKLAFYPVLSLGFTVRLGGD